MAIDIRTLLCYKLFALVKANEDFIDKEMSQFDLSRTQWKILIRFNFLEVPCPQQQLLKAIDIDAAHLTRVLDQLEKRKLLVRTRLPSDKRNSTS
jgi:DNA-binding MarR family transcriptional regulator